MSTPNDGGPAFPAPGVYVDENVCPRLVEAGELGMSLRDYFAAQALVGLTATLRASDAELVGMRPLINNTAVTAYAFADAMLKHRKGGG